MPFRESNPLRAAEKYVMQGRILDAISYYRKAVEGDCANLTYMNILGDLCLRAGHTQDALGYFKQIAEGYCEQGFWSRAIAMYKKVVKLDPANPNLKTRLADLYLQTGLAGRARETYLQVADQYARSGQIRQARESIERAVSIVPSDASAHMRLGEIYTHEESYDRAHDAYIAAGTLFLQNGEVKQALDASIKAASINPESLQALETLTRVYTQLGQSYKAIKLLCELVEKKPGDVELLATLGRAYLSAGLIDEAEEVLLALAVEDPSRSHYLLEVGEKLLERGDLDRAAKQIDGCLNLLIAKRQESKAIDLLRRVLDRDSDNVASLKRLAQVFWHIREESDLIATLRSLAEAAIRKGKDAEAIEALKELVHLEPDEPTHRQRLYDLGAQLVVGADSLDVVSATLPLDSGAAFNISIIRQINEKGFDITEMTDLSQHQSGPTAHKGDGATTSSEPFSQLVDSGSDEKACHILMTGILEDSTEREDSPARKASRTDTRSDALSRILRNELEGIDFYLAQGYNEVARVSLDSLRQKHGDLTEILARYKYLDGTINVQSQSGSPGPGEIITMSPAVRSQSSSNTLTKRICRAKTFADSGDLARAIAILKEVINKERDNVWLRKKLKHLYIRAGIISMAANESLQIARIQEMDKLTARAEDTIAQVNEAGQGQSN